MEPPHRADAWRDSTWLLIIIDFYQFWFGDYKRLLSSVITKSINYWHTVQCTTSSRCLRRVSLIAVVNAVLCLQLKTKEACRVIDALDLNSRFPCSLSCDRKSKLAWRTYGMQSHSVFGKECATARRQKYFGNLLCKSFRWQIFPVVSALVSSTNRRTLPKPRCEIFWRKPRRI